MDGGPGAPRDAIEKTLDIGCTDHFGSNLVRSGAGGTRPVKIHFSYSMDRDSRTQSHDFEIYVRLLLLTPMRSDKEAARMKWKHVPFREQYIIVAESKTAAGERRIISMNDELMVLLSAHAELHIPQCLLSAICLAKVASCRIL